MHKIKIRASSYKGRREKNEDCFCIIKMKKSLYVLAIADGMGGYGGGDIASKMAINELKTNLENVWKKVDYNLVKLKEKIPSIFENINKVIYEYSQKNEKNIDMGTTIAAVFIKKGKFFTAHLGDSRCYLLKKNNLEQLTEDHSVIVDQIKKGIIKEKDAVNHPYRNAIYKNLGKEIFNSPDISPQGKDLRSIPENSIIMLSTDGLHSFVNEIEILQILDNSINLKEACFSLIKTALKNNSNDNITVVLFEYHNYPKSEFAKIKKTKIRILNLLTLLTLSMLIALGTILLRFFPINIPLNTANQIIKVKSIKDDKCQIKIIKGEENNFLKKEIILKKQRKISKIYIDKKIGNLFDCTIKKGKENIKKGEIFYVEEGKK